MAIIYGFFFVSFIVLGFIGSFIFGAAGFVVGSILAVLLTVGLAFLVD